MNLGVIIYQQQPTILITHWLPPPLIFSHFTLEGTNKK